MAKPLKLGATNLADLLPWQAGHRREFLRNFLLQIYFTFIQSILMLTFLGIMSGIAIALQANFGLALLGNNNQLGKVLVFIVFREIAPLVSSMLIIARSGTAMAAEMATIKFQQEVEALHIMGINVFHYLLAPRILGGIVSLTCMGILFLGCALVGGFIGANVNANFPLSQYLTSIANAIRPADFLFFGLKTTIIGGVCAHTACQRGLSLKSAPFEVPIVTNRAVVDSLTFAMAIHFGLSIVYYLVYGIDL